MFSIDDLVRKVGNSYVAALVIAKRARQLNEGATPLIELKEPHKPLFIALAELMADRFSFEFVEE
ncbi:MAG: DNA-directed RNA polymerase subunit omega [Atribacterota bacterium]|nr:DNA-directed RNA polymerase subunit omega [Atribacterota bacterium]